MYYNFKTTMLPPSIKDARAAAARAARAARAAAARAAAARAALVANPVAKQLFP